jgi:ligand-binding sensor domain-containing protein
MADIRGRVYTSLTFIKAKNINNFAGLLRLLCCLMLLIFSGNLLAHANIRFKHISPDQGLSQSSINALLEDKQGFMWIGTQDGLNRYDGYRFKTYRHDVNDSHSLSSNWITALYQDDDGFLWVGTHDGLNRFDPLSQKFEHYTMSGTGRAFGDHHFTGTMENLVGLWFICSGVYVNY